MLGRSIYKKVGWLSWGSFALVAVSCSEVATKSAPVELPTPSAARPQTMAAPRSPAAAGPRGTGQGFREMVWNPELGSAPTYQLGADNTLSAQPVAADTLTLRQPAEASDAGGSVTFSSEPLAAPHILLGHAALKLRASLSAADANFYVELSDVSADGAEVLVNDGFLKASHRASHVGPEPVTIGVAVDYVIQIRPDHHRFAMGHRVRVRISGGDSMSLAPSAQPVEITIHTGEGSALYMPAGF
jgi:uncharacterized protein